MTISLPGELHEALRQRKGSIAVSEVCAAALWAEVRKLRVTEELLRLAAERHPELLREAEAAVQEEP